MTFVSEAVKSLGGHVVLTENVLRCHQGLINLFGGCAGRLLVWQVVFAPNSWGRNHSNPSYHLPAMYEMWARVYEIEEIPGAAFWHKAARTSRLFLKR